MKTFSRRSMCIVALAFLTLGGGRARADERIAGATSQVMAAGKTHALFIKAGTSTASWGSNGSGELGNKATSSSATSTPLNYLGGSPRQVAAGDAFTDALDATGRLWTCGKSDKGQTGQGAKASPLTVPTIIGTDVYTSVAAGTSHAAAVSTSGILTTWGDNAKGEIGNGSTASVITKAVVGSALNDRWLSVSAGNQFTAALKSDGSAWTWGHGTSGQLGINGTADKNTPQAVTSTTPWVALSAGDSHVLGIKADGTLWAWGLNDKAQIGDSTLATTALQKTPLQITSPSGSWLAVSAGGHDSFALRSDGTLWAWGDNGTGQLGISNSNATVNTPTQVGAGGWQYVKAGYDFTIGVMADGNVFTWGHGASGQLGNGATSNTTVPGSPIFYAVKPGMLSGGASHAADLRTSGVLTTYGSPGSGALGQSADQLADCSTYACPQPGAIASTKAWRMVATGADQTLGIKSDGTLWAWGGNSYGQRRQREDDAAGDARADRHLEALGQGVRRADEQQQLRAAGRRHAVRVGQQRHAAARDVDVGDEDRPRGRLGQQAMGHGLDGRAAHDGHHGRRQALDLGQQRLRRARRRLQHDAGAGDADAGRHLAHLAQRLGRRGRQLRDQRRERSLQLGPQRQRRARRRHAELDEHADEERLAVADREHLPDVGVGAHRRRPRRRPGMGRELQRRDRLGRHEQLPLPRRLQPAGAARDPRVRRLDGVRDRQRGARLRRRIQRGGRGGRRLRQRPRRVAHLARRSGRHRPREHRARRLERHRLRQQRQRRQRLHGLEQLDHRGAQTNTWFQLDMGESVESFSQIRLDAGNTTNYPRSYKVTTSNDGKTWSSSIATGTGTGRSAVITFPVAMARYLRITETATSTTPWNISVISVLF